MRCPVCGKEFIHEIDDCPVCDTKNINPTFLNQSDAADWQESIDFAKAIWFLEENSPTMKMLTAEFRNNAVHRTVQQLDIYFDYITLKEKIKADSHDYISVSWMVDFLVQIYTFPNNYPVSSRKYVKNEITYYISFLKNLRGNTAEARFSDNCVKAVSTLMCAEVELADGNVSRALLYYYEFLTSPIIYDGVRSFRTNADYIKNDDDIKFVAHNCKELCKLFLLDGEANFADVCEKLSSSLSTVTDGSFYMHGMDCSIIGPNDSADSRIFFSRMKKNACTLETCNYQGLLLRTGLADFGIGCENAVTTGYDADFNKTWSIEYRTLECDYRTTLSERNKMQSEINRILALLGY